MSYNIICERIFTCFLTKLLLSQKKVVKYNLLRFPICSLSEIFRKIARKTKSYVEFSIWIRIRDFYGFGFEGRWLILSYFVFSCISRPASHLVRLFWDTKLNILDKSKVTLATNILKTMRISFSQTKFLDISHKGFWCGGCKDAYKEF